MTLLQDGMFKGIPSHNLGPATLQVVKRWLGRLIFHPKTRLTQWPTIDPTRESSPTFSTTVELSIGIPPCRKMYPVFAGPPRAPSWQ